MKSMLLEFKVRWSLSLIKRPLSRRIPSLSNLCLSEKASRVPSLSTTKVAKTHKTKVPKDTKKGCLGKNTVMSFGHMFRT